MHTTGHGLTRDTDTGRRGTGPAEYSALILRHFGRAVLAVQSHSTRFNTHPTDAIPGELELELELVSAGANI